MSCLLIRTKAVYIFNGLDDSPQKTRPAKRRKVAGKAGKARDPVAPKFRFTPLFNGAEGADCVRLRQELYESAWSDTDRHIQVCFCLPLTGWL